MPHSQKSTAIDYERLSRIQASLREANLNAVIFSLPSDVLLLTGYWPVVGASIAICVCDGPTMLIVPEDEKELAEAGFAQWIETFVPETLDEMESITDALKPVLSASLNRLKINRGSIGVESGASSQAASYLALHLFGNNLTDLLRELLPEATLVPSREWIRSLKSIKTPFEIEKVRTACAIAKESFESAALQICSGMDEPQAAELFRASLSGNANSRKEYLRCDSFAFCMSGPNAAKACAAYARTRFQTLKPEDLVMIHCNSYVDGLWTDITRTYTLQAPTQEQSKMHAAVLAARRAALEQIKPGVRAAAVDSVAREVLKGAGFGPYLRHGTGHGVGFSPMSAYSIPRLHAQSSDVLQEGMVFNVEPAVYIDGYGGVRHCDMVVVTSSGYELLTDFQSDLASLALPSCSYERKKSVKAGTHF